MKNNFLFLTALLVSPVQILGETLPNILLIQTDEHNLKTLSCYRKYLPEEMKAVWGKDAVLETPNIDRIANNGILFSNCYATTPVSSPSRAAMLTGLYPQNNDVTGNDIPLNKQVITLAEILRDNGYRTGYFGKLHLHGPEKPGWRPSRDYGFSDHDYMYNRGHEKYITMTDNKPGFAPAKTVNLPDSSFTTDFLTARTIDFIRINSKKPYFCFVSYPDPHGPNFVRSPYDKMFSNLTFDRPFSASKSQANLPVWNKGNAKMENMGKYFGMIKCLDDNIGKIINQIPNDQLNNTIIIFTSDHGDLCGEHGLVNKGVPMDGSSKVPFIVSYPQKLNKGIKQDQVVSLIDLTPTLLSIAGIKPPVSFDGRDVSHLFSKGKLSKRTDDAIYLRGAFTKFENGKSSWISVICDNYKLTLSENPNDVPWLVDLTADPNELINLYEDNRYKNEKVKLTTKLREYCLKYNEPRYQNEKIKNELL